MKNKSVLSGSAQLCLAGAEPVGPGELARLKAAAPLKPKVPQQPLEFGLFGDSAGQLELLKGV